MDLEAQVYEDQKARRNLALAGRRLPPAGPGLGSDGRPLFEVVAEIHEHDATDGIGNGE